MKSKKLIGCLNQFGTGRAPVLYQACCLGGVVQKKSLNYYGATAKSRR